MMFSDPVVEVRRAKKLSHSNIWTDVKHKVWTKSDRIVPQSHRGWLDKRVEYKSRENLEQKRKDEMDLGALEKKCKERRAKSERAYSKWINSKRHQYPNIVAKISTPHGDNYKSSSNNNLNNNIKDEAKESLENGQFYVTCVHRPHSASSTTSYN